jgi:ApaG protein
MVAFIGLLLGKIQENRQEAHSFVASGDEARESRTILRGWPRGAKREERMNTSEATTRGVRVEVRSHYLREKSNPAQHQWFFAYDIRISNVGSDIVQLLNRHWIITDANGHVEEVRGPGVVGDQPVLAPGESYEYTSFCPLATPFGTMEGSYQMVTDGGASFLATIAQFALIEPMTVN